MPSTENSALAHAVYFTLKDSSLESRDSFIAACNKYLTDHPGTLHYGAGPRAEEYRRPVNDSQFDIALVLVFASKADHDRYQQSDRHQQFIAEQQENWSQVRVFDSYA